MSNLSPHPPASTGRWLRRGRYLVGLAMVGLMALGLVGQVVRDRSAAWALLMYLPLPILGLGAVLLDLLSQGRALAIGWRFGLTALGLVVGIGSSLRMVAWGLPSPQEMPRVAVGPTPETLTLLHWNVVWGGGRHRNAASWASLRQTIAAEAADLIVLSEAPPDDWLDEVTAALGPAGNRVGIENGPGESYWYKLVVASRRPLRFCRREAVRNGTAMVVEVQAGGLDGGDHGLMRLLVADGVSSPRIARTPFLLDLAAACDRAEVDGAPIDLVVGDFNSVGRSLGFDALASRGFMLAARATPGQWRGTFPAVAPMLDIDHVWVAPRLTRGLACRLFTNFASDHRGQVVTLGLPWTPAPRAANPLPSLGAGPP